LDDNRDKEMMRNQLIAIILMTVLFVAYFKFFSPTQPQHKIEPAQTAQQAVNNSAKEAEKPSTQAPVNHAGSALPPVSEIADPSAEEVILSDDKMELTFTRIGGRLKCAKLLFGGKDDASVQLVPTESVPDTEAVYPFGLQFTDETIADGLNYRRFDAQKDPSGKSVTFSYAIPDRGVIRKTFTIGDRSNIIEARVDYENATDKPQLLGLDQTPAYYLYWGPNIHSGDEKMGVKQAFVWRQTGKVEELPTANMVPSEGQEFFSKNVLNPDWVAVRSTYFAIAFKPEFEGGQGWASGGPKRFRFGFAAPRFEAPPKSVQSNSFSIYLGPCKQQSLAAAWQTLPEMFRFFQPPWGFMDKFAKMLLRLLNWFYHYIPNYGLGIIFLTVVVRFAMYPLTLKSMKSMKKMQLLGPELEALKEKYGENTQELNKKMMELYKERGVNPVGGCLPLMLQMPVFIALYRTLWSAFELRGAPFYLWINDLSQPDKMFHIPALAGIPVVSMFEYINLLPILMGLAMILSQKVMPVSGPAQNSQQKMMMNIMPLFFAFMCYSMASGLNLYILTSTILGVVQQKFIRVADSELKAKKAPAKRQHFYAAAQARKRQMVREAKKEKRKP
jgi:YidC/Oxa1 family membrane protein insertase